MILQALCELSRAEKLIDDPDYEYKPLSWVVRLKDNGKLVNIEDHRRDLNEGKTRQGGKPVKSKWVGKDEPIPVQPTRTRGDLAFFLVDKAEYVFGIDPGGKRPADKLKTRADLFLQQVRACADETADPGVAAVAAFLRSVTGSPSGMTFPKEASPGDLFAFKVGEGTFVHLRPKVRGWWKRRREVGQSGAEPRFRCLVTGQPLHEVELFPLIKRVPGGTPSGVALVSHNARAFESYGLNGNDNAPVSREAAQAAATALNRLLDPEPLDGKGNRLSRRHYRLSADTIVVFWSPEGDPDALDAILGLTEAESADAVAHAYRSIWRGEPPAIKEPSRFYAMTLTGTQGRVIVRDWLETTVTQVLKSLTQHFEDLRVVRNTRPAKGKELPPALGIRTLLDALAAQGKSDRVPDALAADFTRAALSGQPYPLGILQRALLRQRAEAGDDDWIDEVRRDARAALIKAVLLRERRRFSQNQTLIPEVTMSLNPDNDEPGYVLGTMMAVLERLQQIAIEGANATVVDRCFSAASACPQAVMIRLLKNARHHVQKKRDDAEVGGTVFLLDRLLDEFCDHFQIDRRRYPYATGGIPAHLDLVQQGLFVLGYHQMRKWLWMTKEERAEWEKGYPEAPRAYLWSKRDKTECVLSPAIAS